MKFSQVMAIRRPKPVSRIRHEGKVLWSNEVRYVSFGDSIAAGHAINSRWETEYGTGSQYGVNGNTETVIVPNCYTDLIRKELQEHSANVKTVSYARSGDKTSDLIAKLDNAEVRASVEEADFVTVCIGANDILSTVPGHLGAYVETGDAALNALTAEVNANLDALADDSNPNSYAALINKLKAINPKAKYVFTTIYNPYKYLWVDEGQNGFFGPLLNTIPQMTILGFDVDEAIKNGLLQTDIVQLFFDRINGLDSVVEGFVTRLNDVIRSKVAGHENFAVAESKTLWEVFPDRPVAAAKHYNDLVNVEFTRGFDVAEMDWGKLWEGSSAGDFWLNLATKYVSLSGLDISGFATDLMGQVVEKVVMPDCDPHPEEYGQYVLMRSFADVFGWEALDRHYITFAANGGTGAMETQMVVGVDGLPAFTNIRANAFGIPAEGYYFNGWNTAAGGGGVAYTDGQFIGLSGDFTLYAQWSNIYAVHYMHTNHTNLYGDDETGHMECYALYINGELMPKLGKFSDGNRPTYQVPYGSTIKVVVSNYNPSELIYDDATCDIYWNGTSIKSGYRGTEYEFTLTSHLIIDFRWKIAGSLATFDAQSWEDCYITTQ